MRSTVFLFIIAIAGFLSAPALNFVFDPTDVLKLPAVSEKPAANLRHIKMAKMLDHDRFDGLIMGSSRSGLMDVDWFALEGEWYNASVLDARPTDVLAMLETLNRNALMPQTVVLGLDTSGLADTPLPSSTLHHPSTTGSSVSGWLIANLFAPNAFEIFSLIAEPDLGAPMIRHHFDVSGHYALPLYDMLIEENEDAYIAGNVINPVTGDLQYTVSADQLTALKTLTELVRDAGTKLCVFWHPHRFEVLASFDPQDISAMQKDVAAAIDVSLDILSTESSSDPSAWYDAKHLRPEQTRRVILLVKEACSL